MKIPWLGNAEFNETWDKIHGFAIDEVMQSMVIAFAADYFSTVTRYAREDQKVKHHISFESREVINVARKGGMILTRYQAMVLHMGTNLGPTLIERVGVFHCPPPHTKLTYFGVYGEDQAFPPWTLISGLEYLANLVGRRV